MIMIESGMSITSTAKELGVDAQTLSKRLQKQRGLVVLKDGKKSIDSNYFSVINTEEKAYWLGFLAADGSIGNNNDIELALKYDDKDHVEKFKKALNSKHKIGEKTINLNGKVFKAARIVMRDTKLHDDLCKYGVCSNKSFITRFPFEIPKEFYKDFLRGYFDGDGSIYSYNQANGKLRYEIAISTGSIDMVNDLIQVVKEETNLFLKFREARTCYDVRLYTQEHIKDFLKYLYEDASIYLDRKYELYTCAVLS
jgi:DNA-binding transcriptional regulator WhiA